MDKRVKLREIFRRSSSKRDPNLFELTDKTKLTKSHWNTGKNISRQQEAKCMEALRENCNKKEIYLSSSLVYRFACYNDFDVKKAEKDIMRRYDSPYLFIKMSADLSSFISSLHVVVPIPGLKTKFNNLDCIYMNPQTWRPNPKDNTLLVDNFCYALSYMLSSKSKCRRGVACIANCKNYTMKNYHVATIMKIVQAAQGDLVPTKVEFLIFVDPPKFFRSTWNVIKRATSNDFLKKVHLIRRERLDEFLMEGYENYLPNDIQGGTVDKEEIVEDWLDSATFRDQRSSTLLDNSTETGGNDASIRIDDSGCLTIDRTHRTDDTELTRMDSITRKILDCGPQDPFT